MFDNERIRTHELVHWKQYRKHGAVAFYVSYVAGWIGAGFSYTDNWMEKKARSSTNSE